MKKLFEAYQDVKFRLCHHTQDFLHAIMSWWLNTKFFWLCCKIVIQLQWDCLFCQPLPKHTSFYICTFIHTHTHMHHRCMRVVSISFVVVLLSLTCRIAITIQMLCLRSHLPNNVNIKWMLRHTDQTMQICTPCLHTVVRRPCPEDYLKKHKPFNTGLHIFANALPSQMLLRIRSWIIPVVRPAPEKKNAGR